ncbi:MAG: anti-sigma factor [Steroidobacteraceae bacterium]
MTFSDETVMAYADGELDEATRAAVELAMVGDPDLARRVARERGLRAQLRREFDPTLAEPVPERLLAAARGGSAAKPDTDNVITLKRRPVRQWAWPQWGAIAASLVLGVLIAPLLRREPAHETLAMRDGKLMVSGALRAALTEQLASTQPAPAPVRVGLSFRSRNGDYCRTFTLHEQGAVAGVACRDRDSWRIEALAATRPASSGSGEYQPAASAMPAGVERAVSELIVGEPLDAKAEAAARDSGWH